MSALAVMRGTSMWPLLREGMLLQVAQPVRYMRGQIAVFKAGDRLVAHRIVKTPNSAIVCCGDAQPDRLEVVDRTDVVGVVQAVYRSDGARMRRIDSVLFRARGAAFAYLQPLRALYQRAAPHRRERTYRLLVQATAAFLRGDTPAVLRAAEQATPWRFAVMAERHGMTHVILSALEPLNGDPHARAVRATLQRMQRAHIAPSRTDADYPTLHEIFVFANAGDALPARASRAVLLLAAQLRGLPCTADPDTRRLAVWMVQREDLPQALRTRCECINAWFAADRSRAAAFIAAAVRQKTLQARVARLASAAAIAVYLRFMR